MNCSFIIPSGNTVVTGVTTFNLIDSFSGSSLFSTGQTFSYNAISLSQLSLLTSVNYKQRTEDFISYVHTAEKTFNPNLNDLNTLLNISEIANFNECFLPPTNVVLVQSDILLANGEFNLTWEDKSVGELQFDVQYEINADGNWINAPSQPAAAEVENHIFLIAVVNGDVVKGRVRATWSGGSTVWVTGNSVITLIETIPLAPSNVVLSFDQVTEIDADFNVVWDDNSTNEDFFDIQYSRNSGIWINAPTQPVIENIETFDFTLPITDGDTFTTRVSSRNTVGSSAWVTGNTITALALPNAPSDMFVRQGISSESGASFRVLWQDNSTNEDGFNIQYAVDSGGGYGAWVDLPPQPATTANTSEFNVGSVQFFSEVVTLESNVTVKFQMRAFNAAGSSDWISPDLPIIITIVPTAPEFISRVWSAPLERMSIAWDNVTPVGETGYQLQVKVNNGSFNALRNFAGGAVSSYIYYPIPGVTYTYRIRTLDGKLSSSWVTSTSIFATPAATTTSTSGGGGGGGGCLLGMHSLMVSPYKYVNIKDLKIGDELYTAQHDDINNLGFFKIKNYRVGKLNEYFKFTFEDKTETNCTPSHKYITSEGERIADTMNVGESVLQFIGSDFYELKIIDIEKIEKDIEYYKLEVEDARSFISENNILHHNKDIIEVFDDDENPN